MNIEQLKAKRESLKAQLDQIDSQLEHHFAQEKAGVIETIRKTMSEYGIPVESLAKSLKVRLTKVKKPSHPPKYMNRKTGQTWSGRGRAPDWIKTVRNREKFLIEQ